MWVSRASAAAERSQLLLASWARMSASGSAGKMSHRLLTPSECASTRDALPISCNWYYVEIRKLYHYFTVLVLQSCGEGGGHVAVLGGSPGLLNLGLRALLGALLGGC